MSQFDSHLKASGTSVKYIDITFSEMKVGTFFLRKRKVCLKLKGEHRMQDLGTTTPVTGIIVILATGVLIPVRPLSFLLFENYEPTEKEKIMAIPYLI